MEIGTLSHEDQEWSIGIDEAGRGAVIGPLFVGCVAATPEAIEEMERIGIVDSKALNQAKRTQMRDAILSLSPNMLRWELIEASPEQIDQAVTERSLNELELDLFADAVAKIGQMNTCTILADACDADADRFGRRLASRLLAHGISHQVLAEHKADLNHRVVAAASIIAKVARDEAITTLRNELGIEFGSGYPSDTSTQKALTELLSSQDTSEVLRWSWSTTKRAARDLGLSRTDRWGHQRSLSDFMRE